MAARRLVVIACVAAALAALSGCGTPESVRTLSSRTGDAAITLSTQLDRFARKSREVTEHRAEAISRLSAVVARDRGKFSRDMEIYAVANDATRVQAYRELIALSDKLIAMEVDADHHMQNELSEITTQMGDLETRAKGLREVGVELVGMSEDSSTLEDVGFFVKFVKEVYRDVETARDEAEKSADKAKAGAEENAKKGEAAAQTQ